LKVILEKLTIGRDGKVYATISHTHAHNKPTLIFLRDKLEDLEAVMKEDLEGAD